jgi:glycosyltransferase involved in cell wall biosynthesis
VDFTLPTARRVPRWVRAPGNKFDRVCRLASEVWAGSEVLAEWCRQRNENVLVVPTVVPVPLALPDASAERTVGWIGSPSTQSFVEAVLPPLRGIDPPPRAVIVGGDVDLRAAGLAGRVDGWSQETEDAALAAIRVGLYPIDADHPMADGKCGLKAILFLAHGVPVVLTPTPTNARIVRDGLEGIHASTPEEWTEGVRRLLDDAELWERLRRAGHARVLEEFSLAVWAPRVADRLASLTAG